MCRKLFDHCKLKRKRAQVGSFILNKNSKENNITNPFLSADSLIFLNCLLRVFYVDLKFSVNLVIEVFCNILLVICKKIPTEKFLCMLLSETKNKAIFLTFWNNHWNC